MTAEMRWQIRFLLDEIFKRSGYSDKAKDHDERVDEFLKELEKLWPVESR